MTVLPIEVLAQQPTVRFSDDYLALRFTDRFKDDLRHVAQWGKWFRWDGSRWVEDNTLHVFDLARALCREMALQSNKPRKEMVSAKTVAAVERLARSDKRHAIADSEWNADLFIFNERETDNDD